MTNKTLEELMPEVATVFSAHEGSLLNCMSILSTSITKQEEENKLKASQAEILQLRADVKKSADFLTETKATVQRLEKMQERLLSELNEFRRENAQKESAIEKLEEMQETQLAALGDHVDELNKRFEVLSRMKLEQKDLVRRLDMQEKGAAEMKFSVAMLSKSIGDDDTGGASPIVPLVPLIPAKSRPSLEKMAQIQRHSTAHLNRKRTAIGLTLAEDVASTGEGDDDDDDGMVDLTLPPLTLGLRRGTTVRDEAPVIVSAPPPVSSVGGRSKSVKAPVLAVVTTEVLNKQASFQSPTTTLPSNAAPTNTSAIDTIDAQEVLQATEDAAQPSATATLSARRQSAAGLVESTAAEPESVVMAAIDAFVPVEEPPVVVDEVDQAILETFPSGQGSVDVVAPTVADEPAARQKEQPLSLAAGTPPPTEPTETAAPPQLAKQPSSPQVVETVAASPLVKQKSNSSVGTPPTPAPSPLEKQQSTQSVAENTPTSTPADTTQPTTRRKSVKVPPTDAPRKASIKSVAPEQAPPALSARRQSNTSSIAESPRTAIAVHPHPPPTLRSSEEYQYLWHWSISNILALYRMHGKNNVHKLLAGTKKDTVGARVRQVEESIEAMQTDLGDLRGKLEFVTDVREAMDDVKAETHKLEAQVASMQLGFDQTESDTQLLKSQVGQLDEFIQEVVGNFRAAQNKTPPKPDTPRPVDPTVPVAAFEALEAHVIEIDTSLARFDPFVVECQAIQDANKKEMAAIVAAMGAQKSILEKEMAKAADEGRKRAAELKTAIDDAIQYANGIVDRVYVWVQCLGETLHLAFSPDKPSDSAFYRLLVATFRAKYASLGAKLLLLKAQMAGSPVENEVVAVCHNIDGLADIKERDVERYLVTAFPLLAALLGALEKWDSERSMPLVRLVRESLVEGKALACVSSLTLRFHQVQAKIAGVVAAGDDTKGIVVRHSTEIHELNHLHAAIKAMSIKVEYVVNNTQMMIVEDDLKKAVARMNDEREQLRTELEQTIRQNATMSMEKEASLQREVTALASRVHDKADREDLGMAQAGMQEEFERLERDVVSHDEFVVLSEHLKRKPDAHDIRSYVRQKIAGLKIQSTEGNHDAPLLGSVPMRCISCQNVVDAKADQSKAEIKGPAGAPLPFTTSSMRHVQKQKMEALLHAKTHK
ncbi:Aste57867_15299 [Aphanomyces stellatus]|uniref:Aste57867_15299 protein n=1 Tax=Aphanomyces stellatus TaxID=120398 RepID=A0A485L3S9_9STRA|nr:hypothetical protein As57867_015243 [Aphanomyces stellatus]VFT92108.1 Aste57867_15299 [Aphanomyces stellatus]